MTGPNWKLEDDVKTVTLSLPTTPPAALQMDALGIDGLLENLGDFRALMQPEVPKTFPMGQMVDAIPDPAWVTEPDAMLGNTVLHIRDPRYGWLHYVIPREEARKLASVLQNQVDAPPPGPPQGKLS
jgi:hypothetical protein